MTRATAGIRLGVEQGHLAGDSWQQGGIVLLNSKPEVLFQVSDAYHVSMTHVIDLLYSQAVFIAGKSGVVCCL